MTKKKELKEYNIVVEKTFIYPMKVKATTKKEATQIATDYKKKKENWRLKNERYIHEEKYRTEQQNAAIHVLFDQWTKALNDNDVTMVEVLASFNNFDIFPTRESVKELWRSIQLQLFGFKSTRRLKKDEQIDKIYEPINKVFATDYGIHVPFPSRETLHYEEISQQQ